MQTSQAQSPQEIHIQFQHLEENYNITLIKDEQSSYSKHPSIDISGVHYTVLSDQDKTQKVREILQSISQKPITSKEDLVGRLSRLNKEQAEAVRTVGAGILMTQTVPTSSASTPEAQIALQKRHQIEQSYEKLAADLRQYAGEHGEHLKGGALLVQVVGVKGSTPLVFGQRSVNDASPVLVDQNTLGRTGSGTKLWAGLLANILTSKYGEYISMEDGLGKFAPQEMLKKFGIIGPDGQDIVDPQLAQEISVEGLIGMMAGLEYELPMPRNPPISTLDQYLRGPEIRNGSIHILFHPQDKMNFYTNNISIVAYPIEKAYKKVLAKQLIETNQFQETDTLRELSQKLEPFRNQLRQRIKEMEDTIDTLQQLGSKDAKKSYEMRLSYLKEDLKKLDIPEPALDLTLKELMDCQTAYITSGGTSHYLYDLLDLFLMPSNKHQVDYAEIMQREFLQPLGMTRSGFYGVSGEQMDVTFENAAGKSQSRAPPRDHPLLHGCGFGRTSLSDASKLAQSLANPRGLIANNGQVLLSRAELEQFFQPHGSYEAWGLGGAELTCDGQVIDKGGSLNQDQYSFWVDRNSGVGVIAMCNCGRRPDALLDAFKRKIENINYPLSKRTPKEVEGSPLGISTSHYFDQPLVLKDVNTLFEGTRGRVAVLFDFDDASVTKGIIHWSGTPLEVEKQEDGAFHVKTPGRFYDLIIRKIPGRATGKEYLTIGDNAFIAIDKSQLPSQEMVTAAEKYFPAFRGQYENDAHPEFGVLEFEVLEDPRRGSILLGARDGHDGPFVPQSIVEVDQGGNYILFNGHDRQPPDKIFKFVRDAAGGPWRLQVLDYASRTFIEQRPKKP